MPLRFEYNAKSDTVELYIYDIVGADFFGEGVTAKSTAEVLKEAKSAKAINVRINSPGGDVFEGMAIRNLLVQSGKKVTVDIDGLAASIASVIAMAGSEIRMAEGGMMMIHDAWAGTIGNSDELRKTADVLDQISGEIAGIYARRVISDEKAMRKLMKAETWMTASDAMEQGFITAVAEPMRMAASIDPKRFKYQNIPQQFMPGERGTFQIDPLKGHKERIAAAKLLSQDSEPDGMEA